MLNLATSITCIMILAMPNQIRAAFFSLKCRNSLKFKHRETEEVLGLQLKKGSLLAEISYPGALLTPLESRIQMLLGILTGVIGMVHAKVTKVRHPILPLYSFILHLYDHFYVIFF